jgi:hypothetical protein
MIDRIENKRFEKNIKLFRWLAVLTLIIAIIKISLDPNIFNSSGRKFDFIISLLPISLFLQYRQTANKWGGQFIEWTENEISFKSRKYDNTIINLDDIDEILIKLDTIEIRTKNKNFVINIEDYTDYQIRLRLKNNFEKIKERIAHNND